MLRTTNQHKAYWINRKIDWVRSYCDPSNPKDTVDHPHRNLIIKALHKMKFATVYEMGCASGANLYRIVKTFPYVRVGGVDLNVDAIETARKFLPGNSLLEARSAEDVFMNDKSVDVLLTDMMLIYFGPRQIHKVLNEIKRITRSYVIFVEFHSRSFWKRLRLRLSSGYHSYDYVKLLHRYGFYNVEIRKVTEAEWPGGQPQKEFAYLITAKI